MRRIVRFERRITLEEADTSRIRVRRALLEGVAALGRTIAVEIDGERCEADLVSEPCGCAGEERPHYHAFLRLRGDVELIEGERVLVQLEAL